MPGNPAGIAIAVRGSTSRGPSVAIDGSTITITGGGAYALSGALTAGHVIVDSDADHPVWLILNGIPRGSTARL